MSLKKILKILLAIAFLSGFMFAFQRQTFDQIGRIEGGRQLKARKRATAQIRRLYDEF
ncbi:hypothetical protein R3P38DRAFT_3218521 [Favolaschia claudopus]|uniref:Uncharacterized protein n=1 Tax=Favolaschia claudopus TaxID=2862362 RepID=A0AAW0A439_9AGAR